MPSEKNAEVKINNLYLTQSGTSTLPYCRTRVEGLQKLVSAYGATHTLSADSTTAAKVWTQKSAVGVIGKEIAIVIEFEPEANASAIIALIEAAIGASTDLTIQIVDFISITVTARAVYQNGSYVSWDKRRAGKLQNARFNFICTGEVI